MKNLSLFVLTIVTLGIGQDNPSESVEFTIAATTSEQAAVNQAHFQPVVEDHYGNPDRFIQYIISVPPVHA